MKPASASTSRLRIFTYLLPIVAGVALNVLEEVQLFRRLTVNLPSSYASKATRLHHKNPGRATHSTNNKEKLNNKFRLVHEF
jgi:hypothetical protein